MQQTITNEGSLARADFEVLAFGWYVLRHWRIFAIALAVALPVVLAISLLLPKKYTASASILIEPPAGNDPRGSTAVSPVYLESLKTYEHFASSDSLFAKAVQDLHLRSAYSGVPIEVLKQRVLKVAKPRDTKILEIEATVKDPKLAWNLVRYIASATVEMNRSLERASNSDLTEGGDVVLTTAAKRLEQARKGREQALVEEPVGVLEADVAAANELKNHLLRDLSADQTELAAYQSRSASGKQGPAYVDSAEAAEAVSAARAQVSSLSTQLNQLDTDLVQKEKLLEIHKQHRDLREKELLVAQQQFDAATNQRNEILESIAFRGERLQIIDPGVLPEKASSPNVSLNLAIAALLCVVGSAFYLAVTFARRNAFLFIG